MKKLILTFLVALFACLNSYSQTSKFSVGGEVGLNMYVQRYYTNQNDNDLYFKHNPSVFLGVQYNIIKQISLKSGFYYKGMEYLINLNDFSYQRGFRPYSNYRTKTLMVPLFVKFNIGKKHLFYTSLGAALSFNSFQFLNESLIIETHSHSFIVEIGGEFKLGERFLLNLGTRFISSYKFDVEDGISQQDNMYFTYIELSCGLYYRL